MVFKLTKAPNAALCFFEGRVHYRGKLLINIHTHAFITLAPIMIYQIFLISAL